MEIKMPRTATIQARIDPEVKSKAQRILNALNISMSEAISIYLTQVGGFLLMSKFLMNSQQLLCRNRRKEKNLMKSEVLMNYFRNLIIENLLYHSV